MLGRALKSIFFGKPKTTVFDAPLAPDMPVYVIGDVHGCLVLLDSILKKIAADAASHGQAHKIVLVGDLADRGEKSAQVFARVHELCSQQPDQYVCLQGNHEMMMLEFLDDPAGKGMRWLRYGGLQTLASFGIGGVTDRSDSTAVHAAADSLTRALGADAVQWLRNLPNMWMTGNVAVTHAAFDPDLPVDLQKRATMLWGHPAFLSQSRADGVWVVHGHTIVDAPLCDAGRISVDTGAFATGNLSAAAIFPGECRFLTA